MLVVLIVAPQTTQHFEETVQDIREHCYTEKQDERASHSLDVILGNDVSKTNSRKGCEGEIRHSYYFFERFSLAKLIESEKITLVRFSKFTQNIKGLDCYN